MRHVFFLLLIMACGWGGSVRAQAAVAPVTSLADSIDSVRVQTAQLSQLLVGERLKNPVELHDIAGLLAALSVSLDRMATHAEHGQITDVQRASLDAGIEKTRLMLRQMNERIRTLATP